MVLRNLMFLKTIFFKLTFMSSILLHDITWQKLKPSFMSSYFKGLYFAHLFHF